MNRIVSQNDEINGYADKFFKKYKIGEIMKRSNFSKEKGFSYIYLFRFIYLLVFSGRSLYRFYRQITVVTK